MRRRKFHIRGLLFTHEALRNFVRKVSDNKTITKKDLKKFIRITHLHHSTEEQIFFDSILKKTHNADKIIKELELEHSDFNNLVGRIFKDIESENDLAIDLEILKQKTIKHADIEDSQLLPVFIEHYGYFAQKFIELKICLHINLFRLPNIIKFIYKNLDLDRQKAFKKSLPLPCRVFC